MKKSGQVRRPELANSMITTDKSSQLSIGDALRVAKRNLFFSRCLIGILIVLVITAVILAGYFGYLTPLFSIVSDSVQ